MIEGQVVSAIRTLAGRGVGKKAIAREVGVAVNTVRRYLREPMTAGQQVRPAARRLTDDRREEARTLLTQAENVLIFGAPGVGKTHLAIALGRAVVEAGHSVLFTSATALLAALSKAETDGQLSDRLMFYTKPKLLIIDELGYLPFERRSAHLFFQLVARRYERGSLLITTNQVVTQWGVVFGDDVLAAAILDRLHHSHTLMIQGESYRLRQKKKAGLLGRAPRHDG